jgi:hypothetical protein
MPIADFRLPIADFFFNCRVSHKAGGLQIGNRQSAMALGTPVTST